MAEAEHEISSYPSLGKLFTRRLKPGLRPIQGPLIHPADSYISQAQRIKMGQMIQAKGKMYSVTDLIGDMWAPKFNEGFFLTYYLCPTDYHRVHSPVSGRIIETQYFPGKLWPVNDTSVNAIKNLFAINERTVSIIQTDQGLCAVVMVGATNVGKISLTYEPAILTNQCDRAPKHFKNQSCAVKTGDEFGIFHMGSTVIVLYETGFNFGKELNISLGPVKVGQGL